MSVDKHDCRSVVAIIQARMGSTRLPGKVLADIANHPMLWHVVTRVRRARSVGKVIVATSTHPADDAIAKFCETEEFPLYRGSETDVLDRYYQVANSLRPEAIVRVTADCPLIDPQVIDQVVQTFQSESCDYAANCLVRTFPHGLDTEVFSYTALANAWQDARLPSEREHVTPYLRSSGRFRLVNVESGLDLSRNYYRWTVDEPCDLEFIRTVFARLVPKVDFGWRQVMNLLSASPEIGRINSTSICDEGYYLSLAKEPQQAALLMKFDRSAALREQLENSVANASEGAFPGAMMIGRASGARVWDDDGNEFIDQEMAGGQVLLGHGYPAVEAAVQRQIKAGLGDLPSPRLLAEAAERLRALIPNGEMAYFAASAGQARLAAAAVAKYYTGKELVLAAGATGSEGLCMGNEPPFGVNTAGVVFFQTDDPDSLARCFAAHAGRIAALFIEPCEAFELPSSFVQQASELSRRHGALLILDETDASLRLAKGGGEEFFSIAADLVCLGPGAANGYHFAAVTGPRTIIRQARKVLARSKTGLSGAAIAAAISTLQEISDHNVIAHLWEQGRKLRDGLAVLAREFSVARRVRLSGPSPCSNVVFTDESGKPCSLLERLFAEECRRRGVSFGARQRPSFSHRGPEIEQTLRVYRAAMEIVGDAIRRDRVKEILEGKPVQSAFRTA